MNYKDENFKLNTTYEVVSVFNHVINLRLENKIYAIFNEKITKAPYSLILEEKLFNQIKHQINKTIFIGDINAKTFSCYLNPSDTQHFSLREITPYLQQIKRPAHLLETAFQAKRKQNKFVDLLGLGIGLTPSGDDYIVGYMAGYYWQHAGIHPKFRKLALLAQERTNEISAHYIQNASQRLFKQEILDILQFPQNKKIIEKLAALGASSGVDILYGIHDYFHHQDLEHRI